MKQVLSFFLILIITSTAFSSESNDAPLFKKVVSLSPGLVIADKVTNCIPSDWTLEFCLERPLIKNIDASLSMGLNHLIDSEDPTVSSYEFSSSVRVKLFHSYKLKRSSVSLFLSGSAGFNIDLSNLMQNEQLYMMYAFDDYYSFPLIVSTGLEFANNKKIPQFVFGLKMDFEYVIPFASSQKQINNDEENNSLIPSAFVKWVY